MLHGIVTTAKEPVNLQKCIVLVYSYRWYCELVLYRLQYLCGTHPSETTFTDDPPQVQCTVLVAPSLFFFPRPFPGLLQ